MIALIGSACAHIDDDREQQRLDADGDAILWHQDCDDLDAAVRGPTVWYADNDSDGLGDAAQWVEACDMPSGHVEDSSDCDDTDDTVLGPVPWYQDADGDFFGLEDSTVSACVQPDGYAAQAGDCDDSSASVYPGATEYCNGSDDDCDGVTDEDDAIDALEWFRDADGDGYGDPDSTTQACAAPSGHVADNTDCDDAEPLSWPGRDEDCDGIDNDCDESVDEGVTTSFYRDSDGDSYGDSEQLVEACSPPSGFVALDGDCDDSSDSVHPHALEYCNGVDDDCDDFADEDDAVDRELWFQDDDGDGWGQSSSSQLACAAPSGFTAAHGDCDDTNAAVNPGEAEICNGVDDDCDEAVDDDDSDLVDAGTWYMDGDGDGYGDPAASLALCTCPSGYTANASDCDDNDAGVSPAQSEYCNGVDDDCDGVVDEAGAVDAATWYLDGDGDGYGDATSTRAACDQPSGYVEDASDCDDGDASVHPSASEAFDGVDSDCDGSLDNVGLSAADGVLVGSSAGDMVGFALSPAGDVDGDGYPDLLASSPYEDSVGSSAGVVYLVMGPVTGSLDLDAAQAEFFGEAADDQAGRGLAGGADVDGDGVPDLLVGAPFESTADDEAGAAYLITSLDSAAGSGSLADDAVVFYGASEDERAGIQVGLLGDTDGDGYGQVLVGSDLNAAYLFSGPFTGERTSYEADASIFGEEGGDDAGRYVQVPGDMSGDGVDDVLVGATMNDGYYYRAGALYCAWGPVTSDLDLGDAEAKVAGSRDYDALGSVFASVGDVDGDGYLDLAVGMPQHSVRTADEGVVYLFMGRIAGTVYASAADARIMGSSAYELAGSTLAAAGDVDADGYGDLLVGSPGVHEGGSYAGAAFLFHGPVSGAVITYTADARFDGEGALDGAGDGLLGPGDLDSDGFDDILIRASGDDRGGADAGAVFVFGGF